MTVILIINYIYISEPILQFEHAEYHVNESESYLSATIVRSGMCAHCFEFDINTNFGRPLYAYFFLHVI